MLATLALKGSVKLHQKVVHFVELPGQQLSRNEVFRPEPPIPEVNYSLPKHESRNDVLLQAILLSNSANEVQWRPIQ